MNDILKFVLEADDTGEFKDIMLPDWQDSLKRLRELFANGKVAEDAFIYPSGYLVIVFTDGDMWEAELAHTEISNMLQSWPSLAKVRVTRLTKEQEENPGGQVNPNEGWWQEAAEGDDEDDLVKDVGFGTERAEIAHLLNYGVLEIDGNVDRHGSHNVHAYSTTVSLTAHWNWPDPDPQSEQVGPADPTDRQAYEIRIERAVDALEKEIKEKMIRWNQKIYQELEAEYESQSSMESMADMAEANEWKFDGDGNIKGTRRGLDFEQLSPEAKEHAREQYTHHMFNDPELIDEIVKLEWLWLLDNKGFSGVEIAWSGFWSQGDGASFTAKYIDIPTYLTGPDPLEFPESERQQYEGPPIIEGITNTIVSAVLTPESHELLLQRVPPIHPVVFAHHATIGFKPDSDVLEKYLPQHGKPMRIEVTAMAQDDKAQAVLVSIESTNQFPHITISVAEGVKPAYSNQLLASAQRQDIEPFTLDAVIMVEALRESVEEFDVKEVGHPTTPDEVALQVKAALRQGSRVRNLRIAPSALVKTDRVVMGEMKGTVGEVRAWLNAVAAKFKNPAFIIRPHIITDSFAHRGWTPGFRHRFQMGIAAHTPMAENIEGEEELGKELMPPSVEEIAAAMVEILSQRPDISAIESKPGVQRVSWYFVSGRIKADYWEAMNILKRVANKFYTRNMEDFDVAVTFAAPQDNYPRTFSIGLKPRIPDHLKEGEEEEQDILKDVSKPPARRSIKDIRSKADYREYELRVRDFFHSEGITNLSAKSDEGGTIEPHFSWSPCDCCHRPLGGDRYEADGYNPATNEVQEYEICVDCMYYAEYGQLDDMTMLELEKHPEEDEPIQERYGGAEQERGLWYHGTSAKLIPKIMSEGLITNPKQRAWHEDPKSFGSERGTSIVQTTRKSLPGIYVTTNLGTATLSALKVAQRDKTNDAIIVLSLQPRSMVADEDDVVSHLKHLAPHLSGHAYSHIWPYLMEVYGSQAKDEDRYYTNIFDKQKMDWVNNTAKLLIHGYKENPEPAHPQLEKRVKELLFNEGYRAMLERNVAYIGERPDDWDLGHWKSEWSRGFGDYDQAPAIPNPEQAEAKWLAFGDKLARTLKDKARPIKGSDNWRQVGRLITNVGFVGSNRIICIIEIVDARDPEYRSKMVVHYGKPPPKLIKDWTENKGPLDKPDSITYVREAMEDEESEVAKEMGQPPQRWFFKIYNYQDKKSISYYYTNQTLWRGGPEIGPHQLPDPSLVQAGGQVYPKRMSDDDLRMIANAQIRVFKRTGFYNPEGQRGYNVWRWMKEVRTGNPQIEKGKKF